jgi:sporulation protein YlmC with PRC-barrel domain
MSRSFATACALGALLVAGPALAQTQSADQPATTDETIQALPPAPETQPAQPPQPQGAQAQETQATEPVEVETVEVETVEGEGAAPELEGGFIARQGQNHLMASELMDADVMTSADESLGKVEDMLLDAQGRAVGVVVGVGGFLGIGEKQVAIPTESIQVVYEGEAREAAEGGAAQQPGIGRGLALTGGTDIAHILVEFSREELEQAPDFARLDEQDGEAQAEVPAEGEPVEATGATTAEPEAAHDAEPAQAQ